MARNATTYANSGTYEIIWERAAQPPEDDDFKPIASAGWGVVKFFGRVNDGRSRATGGDGRQRIWPFGETLGRTSPSTKT